METEGAKYTETRFQMGECGLESRCKKQTNKGTMCQEGSTPGGNETCP